MLKVVDLTGENRCATLGEVTIFTLVISFLKVVPGLIRTGARDYLIYLGGKSQ